MVLIKNFLFPKAESPTAFFAQKTLRFGRRAKRGDCPLLAISCLVVYS